MLADVGRSLTSLADELNADAKDHLEAAIRNDAPAVAVGISDDDLARCAARITHARRVRDEIFGDLTFFDPNWDMLLDLFVQQAKGQPVSVSSLCVASAVPATTALRHIAGLEESGAIVRRADPDDKRRMLLSLSDDASAKTRLFLRKMVIEGRAAAAGAISRSRS